MAFHVTQCPGCDSTFNTSARLLESAAGRVRCGSCLTVFEAMQYFVDQDPLQSQDLAENSVFVGNNPQDYFDPANFLTRSALTDKMSDRAFADVEITAEVAFADSEPAQFFTADLSLSEPSDLNQEESDFYEAFAEVVEAQSEADELLIPEPAVDFPASMEQESDDEFGSPESDSAAGQAEADTDPGFAAERAATAAEPSADNTGEEPDSTEAIRARALEVELRDDEALEAIPEENLAALNQVSTPVELLGSGETRWLRQSLLATAMVLLTAILTAQFLWQRMAVYSQLTQIRPFYEFGCQWLTCELPVYSSIEAIRSDNLVVRSHPQRADALLVNVEFRNTADFPQPFPILILSFNTAANSIVALREFSPAEYLDPGLLQVSLMPVATPVQIRLELIDPGPDAVNYTLAFRRPSVFN